MGTLRDLKDSNRNVHMLYTSSDRVDMYVYDVLKDTCDATLDSIMSINTKSDFSMMMDLANMKPFLADRWLFRVDYSKLKGTIKNNIGVFSVDTSCFLVTVKNYKDYKEFKDLVKSVNDLYLSFIRRNEVMYLLSDCSLSSALVDFVAKSYSRDPDKVFVLKDSLAGGAEVNTRRDVVSICGASASSINYFALQLLRDMPTTEKGLKTVYRNRLRTAVDLASAYGFGKFRNFLISSVKDILSIKDLYISGTIYDRIVNVPDCFDEKKLSRYNMYLDEIILIPYERVMRLLILLQNSGKWVNGVSLVSFIYSYYGGLKK